MKKFLLAAALFAILLPLQAQTNPERAAVLFEKAEENAKAKYERLTKYSKLYE